MKENQNISVVDLFCGIGGLSYGLKKAGLNVKAGIDQDESCRYAYENNNIATFISDDISNISGNQITQYWKNDEVKVLVGCAPLARASFARDSKIKKIKKIMSRNYNKIINGLSLVNGTSVTLAPTRDTT